MIYASECSLIYNRKDERYYIYNGEDLVDYTKNKEEAEFIMNKLIMKTDS